MTLLPPIPLATSGKTEATAPASRENAISTVSTDVVTALFSGILETIAGEGIPAVGEKGASPQDCPSDGSPDTLAGSSDGAETAPQIDGFSALTVAMMPPTLPANAGTPALAVAQASSGELAAAPRRESRLDREITSLESISLRPAAAALPGLDAAEGLRSASPVAFSGSETQQREPLQVSSGLLAAEDAEYSVSDPAIERTATNAFVDGVLASAARGVRTLAPEGVTVANLKLPAGNPEQWRPTLLEALGERIQVAVGKHGEHAVIRLDPPMMGSIEVVIRHQAGSLQVQLSATNSEVARQLQGIGDHLRQDLVQGQYTDVSVHVQADAKNGGKQQHAQQEATPGRALAEADDGQADQSFALENA